MSQQYFPVSEWKPHVGDLSKPPTLLAWKHFRPRFMKEGWLCRFQRQYVVHHITVFSGASFILRQLQQHPCLLLLSTMKSFSQRQRGIFFLVQLVSSAAFRRRVKDAKRSEFGGDSRLFHTGNKSAQARQKTRDGLCTIMSEPPTTIYKQYQDWCVK